MAAIQTYEMLKDDYTKLYDTVTFPNNNYNAEVKLLVDKQTVPKNYDIYRQVEIKFGTPWWFVCALHIMECSGNFNTHIHNGDPLSRPTVNVPPNRPSSSWRSPPGTWLESCYDAIRYEKIDLVDNWTLERALFWFEKYNGFRTRLEHNRPTPYLWSYTNHYTKGKFIADGVWSENTVSKQPGVVIILHEIQKKFKFQIVRAKGSNIPTEMSSIDILDTLKKLNFYSGNILSPIKSAEAIIAIKKFQAANGLDADGIVGPKTKAKLIEKKNLKLVFSIFEFIKKLFGK